MCIETLPGEEWRDFPEFEGLYKVSNFGRVYGLVRGALLTPVKDPTTGVCYIKLSHNKNFYSFPLAVVVYNTFHETNHKRVLFKDPDPFNCRLDNLYVSIISMDTYSNDEEVWKSIKFPSLDMYEVSNFGNIRDGTSGKFKKVHTINGRFYVSFRLSDGKIKSFPLADLVYNTFYGTNYKRVNFKDGNCQNVHLSNLYK